MGPARIPRMKKWNMSVIGAGRTAKRTRKVADLLIDLLTWA